MMTLELYSLALIIGGSLGILAGMYVSYKHEQKLKESTTWMDEHRMIKPLLKDPTKYDDPNRIVEVCDYCGILFLAFEKLDDEYFYYALCNVCTSRIAERFR